MITSLRQAAEASDQALRYAWDGELPVKVDLIAETLFVRKKNAATGTSEEIPIVVRALSNEMLDGLSGRAIFSAADQNPVYYCDYNAKEISYRSRFALAHELGHVLLGHLGNEIDQLQDHAFENSDPIEHSANVFASGLLMPEKEVRSFFEVANSVQTLAEAFGVSNNAMVFRLQELGLVSKYA